MKIFKCFILLLLVVVIDVHTAQHCTDSTPAECCLCPEKTCGSCPSGFYIIDQWNLPDTGCGSESTTPSTLNSTTSTGVNTAPSTSIGENSNYSFCVQNCPDGFYGNNDTGGCNSIETIAYTTSTPTTDNLPVIIGGTCGGVVVIVIVIIVVVVIVCRRKRHKQASPGRVNLTLTAEAIGRAPIDVEPLQPRDEEEEVGSKKTATRHPLDAMDLPNSIPQGHDKVLRYTVDPTQSIILRNNRDNEQTAREQSILDQLPPAPAAPKHVKSTRRTKVKKPKPKPTTDDVYEPVGSENTGANDNKQYAKDDESLDEENYENQNEIEKLKSVRKNSLQRSTDHSEEDYENYLVLKDLKFKTKPEKQEPEVKQEVELEQGLEDYENESEIERFRQPTKNPLADESVYVNL
ncbi:hypothetical protein LOTGIDRAFT_175507 [Lottia gigantea]|uniref:TNFR-Cys domain-containing protein n=1 Tax=Lottia gigantea TaxID=225164 RepID=V4AKK8_LOTGI|nr:hypothetical protein LOTGIDRAFT_175507 [Lottia gigantea]ESO94096.1 hypothetical protein LOTGIDRAFT_175507 [Lottia gigantea]